MKFEEVNTIEDFELILFDRLNVIKDVINKYGEQNFYISFSGGKDSTVLHHLIDMALPSNTIPRVYCDTGIEYEYIRSFVYNLKNGDDRFIIIKPNQNIKSMLEKNGYPFKSKEHSRNVSVYRNSGFCTKTVQEYLSGIRNGKETTFKCPNVLMYQFQDDFKLKISDKCCHELKKKTFEQWKKENNKTISMTGMRKSEGGQRNKLNCVIYSKDKTIEKFHPLVVVSDEWEDWFIKKYDIELCKLYYPPFNFKRTGCKGCPFSLDLQEQLEVMELYLPAERKQCEMIWKPVYDEYRRIGYRLKKNENMKLF